MTSHHQRHRPSHRLIALTLYAKFSPFSFSIMRACLDVATKTPAHQRTLQHQATLPPNHRTQPLSYRLAVFPTGAHDRGKKKYFLAPWTFFVSRARPKPSGNKVNAEPPYNQAKPYGLK